MSAPHSRRNVEFYRKQAKSLLRHLRDRDPHAVTRFRTHLPRLHGATDEAIVQATFSLADAQLVVAREAGFSSWPKLKQHIASARDAVTKLSIEWSEALSNHDLKRIDALLGKYEHLKYQEFYPREKLPGYHSATYGPLLWAVWIENFAIVRLLLRHGADPDHPSQSCCPLLLASPAMSDLLIAHGADVNRYSVNGGTPLMWSVGDIDRVHYLLGHGADVNLAKPNSGETPLMLLMGHENEREAVEVAEFLIRSGARVNARTRSGLRDEPIFNHGNDQNISQGRMTAIHLAAEFGRSALVKLLLKHGADPRARTVSRRTEYFGPEDRPFPFHPFAGETPLDWAIRHGNERVIRQLNPDVLDELYWAAAAGIKPQVELLLRRGADPNQLHRESGRYPLDAAVAQKRSEVCRVLLARGANWTGDILDAVELGLEDVVVATLESDPSLKKRLLAAPRQWLHLLHRGEPAHRKICQRVFQSMPALEDDLVMAVALRDPTYVASVQSQFPAALVSALAAVPELACYAVWEPNFLQSVLDAGADIEARDQVHHGTPLHWAIKLDQADSLQRLLERGADPQALLTIGDAGATPLLLVVQQRSDCDLRLVEPLLRHGADPNWRMYNGYTALDILDQRWGNRPDAEYENAIATLRQHGGKRSEELATGA